MIRTRLLLMLFTVILIGCQSEDMTSSSTANLVRPVKLKTITETSSAHRQTYPAKLYSQSQAELSFRVNGQMISLDLIEGQQVTQGDILVRVDPRDAQNALTDAIASHNLSQSEFDRVKEIYSQGLTSKAEFDRAEALLKSAEAAKNAAQDQLDYTIIRAPFSGTVARIWVDNHQLIQAGQPILSLQDNQNLEARIQIPASDVITILNSDATLHAVLTSELHDDIALNLHELSSRANESTQTYNATFRFSLTPEVTLLPGMTSEVILSVEVADSANIISIPLSSVLLDDATNRTFVWVLANGSNFAEKRFVTLGELHSEGIEIISGLAVTERVVTAGATELNEQTKVKELTWQRGI